MRKYINDVTHPLEPRSELLPPSSHPVNAPRAVPEPEELVGPAAAATVTAMQKLHEDSWETVGETILALCGQNLNVTDKRRCTIRGTDVSRNPSATENLLENADGGTRSVFSRGGALLPSVYADARRCIDAVVVCFTGVHREQQP